MATPVDPQQSLPDLDLRVLARWRERDVAREAERRRAGAPARVVWERPAAAVGPGPLEDVPGLVLADVFARYATMRGWAVERRGARDLHGLDVELDVERRFGLPCAAQAARDGVGELTARCRAAALAAAAERDALSERIGVQATPACTTIQPRYVESVWWAIKEIADQGLLHSAVKAEPYCPSCATALCASEIAHRAVVEAAAYVRFRVARDGGPLQAGDELAIWTAAPWTLLANAAVAVDPELTYVRAKTGALEPPVVVAEALAEQVLGDLAGVRILDRFRGAAIDGVRYEPPFGYLPASAFGERGHSVLLAGFVTASEGTGLVSATTALGEDDRRLGARFGLAVVNPVCADGTFDERAGRYAGKHVEDAGAGLLADLRAPRAGAAHPGARARRPALLLLRDAAAVLCQGVLVRRDRAVAGRRPLPCRRRRAAAVARALVGNAAAGLAVPRRARDRHRLAGRARAALGRAGRGPAQAVGRRHLAALRLRAARGARAGPRPAVV